MSDEVPEAITRETRALLRTAGAVAVPLSLLAGFVVINVVGAGLAHAAIKSVGEAVGIGVLLLVPVLLLTFGLLCFACEDRSGVVRLFLVGASIPALMFIGLLSGGLA